MRLARESEADEPRRSATQYEFLRQYSSDPQSIVVGLVRDKATTEDKIANDADLAGRSNIHILQADVSNYSALEVSRDGAPLPGNGVAPMPALGSRSCESSTR